MKKIKLDSKRLQLKKEKIASLTDEAASGILGGDNASAPSTSQLCSLSCRGTCVNCPQPPSNDCPPPATQECPITTSLLVC